MEEKNLLGSVIDDPFERLVIRVSGCMLSEPSFYDSAQVRVARIVSDLAEVAALEPDFIAKLAYYARNELNLRSTPNFITAWAATQQACRASLQEFFTFIINLPSDLLDFTERYQQLKGNTGNPKFSTFIQTLVKKKFCDFNVYQLGKYCSEGKRKRNLLTGGNQKDKAKGVKKINMKLLIRACHVKRPAFLVASILGKRYPGTPEEFASTSLSAEGDFQPELAGKRLKIPTPATWETTMSELGNKAECWESLIRSNKLPFMAMLKNIRNLLVTGVEENIHQKVCEKLRNPEVIQRSRLFPFRFLSAYESIKVDLDYLRKIKEDPNYVPSPEEESKNEEGSRGGRGGRGGRGASRGRGVVRPQRGSRSSSEDDDDANKRNSKSKSKLKIPKIVPTEDTINCYKSALEEAIKLATALNVSPLRGNTVIFCDASGSMAAGISSGPFGSIGTCKSLGFLFGMMMRHICESCEVYIFSSSRGDSEKCWKKAELQGDNIFELIEQMDAIASTMGGGTEYPFDWFETAIAEKHWFDNFIIFSDMIISTANNQMFGQNEVSQNCYQVLSRYREAVNPQARYITVDLAGTGKDMTGATMEDKGKNLVIGGYSDAILKLINFMDTTQAEIVRNCKPAKRGQQIDN